MENIQSIRDFYLAAYLVASGLKLQSTASVPGGTLFNFTDNSSTQAAVDKYYSMNALVEPISYGTSIKTLKSIVHSNETKSKSEGNNYVKQFKGAIRL